MVDDPATPPTHGSPPDGGTPPDGATPPADPAPARSLAGLRRRYGASPAHLLLHVVGILLIAYALREVFGHYAKVRGNLAIWLVAGALLNDFVALPLYVGVDRVARGLWAPVRSRIGSGDGEPPLVSGRGHVRIPAVMAATMLLVYLPNVLGKAPRGHQLSTGLAEQPDYAGRWVLIAVGLFLASAAIYGVRWLRAWASASAARRPSPR